MPPLHGMSDIIKLLPDSIANQIAAGEVIQRPASVVKELLENSVDAGAKNVQLILQDSGRSLVQVVDDGKGMTETDARMSLERHATSKIASADDLFRIKTMGFRGEALASIAAVAQLELKTRSEDREVGTHILVEGSVVKFQEVCASPPGSTISVKNLFFNVPARRKFLKSDPVEMRHVIDEFQRVALSNPDVNFKLFHNEQQIFHLPATNIRQRIIGILGKSYNEKLVPLQEETEVVKLSGFVAKPDAAKKSRGEQFLFVNGRFFKSSYYHSAIQQAFEGLVPKGHHPAYFIYFEVDPASIDVNIHPTKTEIKFEDERTVFAILRSAVKRSLGQYHVSPSLDFERETAFDILPVHKNTHVPAPEIRVDPNFNPFELKTPKVSPQQWERGNVFQKQSTDGWENLYQGIEKDLNIDKPEAEKLELEHDDSQTVVRQIGNRYILVQSQEGIFLLHQYRAHTRILFESFEQGLNAKPSIQKLLFPVTLELTPQDSATLKTVLPSINQIGFEIEEFGQNSFIVHGFPSICSELSIEETISGFIDDLRENRPSEPQKLQARVVRSLAQHSAIKSGNEMKAQEMLTLFRQLMHCNQPQLDLNGKPTFVLMNSGMLDKIFSA
jgi:DNA mismatch repair protein MutL